MQLAAVCPSDVFINDVATKMAQAGRDTEQLALKRFSANLLIKVEQLARGLCEAHACSGE